MPILVAIVIVAYIAGLVFLSKKYSMYGHLNIRLVFVLASIAINILATGTIFFILYLSSGSSISSEPFLMTSGIPCLITAAIIFLSSLILSLCSIKTPTRFIIMFGISIFCVLISIMAGKIVLNEQKISQERNKTVLEKLFD